MNEQNEKPPVTDSHYIKQLVDTADTHTIETTEDIFNQQGVKLVSAGTRVDKSFYKKLVRYKLLKPIDASLGIQQGVSIDTISQVMLGNPENDEIISFLLNSFSDSDLPAKIISQIMLNGPLSVKFTVTRERAPEKFLHCLQVALTAVYIGSCEQLETEALNQLMMAGLLHDLGEMHIDPKIMDRSTPLTPELRRQIYAHPVIAHLIIKEFPEYPEDIGRAVLEHHERLDGSGYPRGLKAEQISRFGRILAVAELVVAMLLRTTDFNYLATSIKLNTTKYDKSLLRHVILLFKNRQQLNSTVDNLSTEKTAQLWCKLANLLVDIPALDSGETLAESDALVFIDEHTQTLRRMILSAGVDPDHIEESIQQLIDAIDDMSELHSMAFESVYRFHELLHETRRRWPRLFYKDVHETESTTLKNWLLLCEERLEFVIASEH